MTSGSGSTEDAGARDAVARTVPSDGRWSRAVRRLAERFLGGGRRPAGMEEVFTSLYARNGWRGTESRSGTGSTFEQTATLRRELPALFRRLGVKTLLDVPCGDFRWMSQIDLSSMQYIGADIVGEMIACNSAAYGGERARFIKLDVTRDPVPKADLIFCRDCLVHHAYDDIFAALRNMAASGSTYLLMTTFPARDANTDMKTGGWRVLNFERAPFMLPPPDVVINEGCTEDGGVFRDKSLGLWTLDTVARCVRH